MSDKIPTKIARILVSKLGRKLIPKSETQASR